jgi:aspartyl-tRNA(Asn)/glutamyl-tRNA(Gln) amidotransferase subunit B
MLQSPGPTALALATELHLIQEHGAATIIPIIKRILDKFPNEVTAYRKGKKNLLGMFMGEVMKATNGKIDPKKANELVREALDT